MQKNENFSPQPPTTSNPSLPPNRGSDSDSANLLQSVPPSLSSILPAPLPPGHSPLPAPRPAALPPAAPLELARQLIPKSVHDRKFRAGSFFNSLTTDQRGLLLQWLADQPVADVQRRIALPHPEGFGIEVSYTSLHRIKASLENVPLSTWLDDAMDAACDTLHSESAADAAPLRETISLLLHSHAVDQLRRKASLQEINQTINAIAKLDRIRAGSSPKRPTPRTSSQKLKLDVTISTTRPSHNDPAITDIKVVPSNPPARP